MTRDDIFKLAQDVGCIDLDGLIDLNKDSLERFLDIVAAFYSYGAAAEREACAQLCESTTASWTQHLYNEGCIDCAKAIRAKGR